MEDEGKTDFGILDKFFNTVMLISGCIAAYAENFFHKNGASELLEKDHDERRK